MRTGDGILNSKFLVHFAKSVPGLLLLICFIVLRHSDPREGQVTLAEDVEVLGGCIWVPEQGLAQALHLLPPALKCPVMPEVK